MSLEGSLRHLNRSCVNSLWQSPYMQWKMNSVEQITIVCWPISELTLPIKCSSYQQVMEKFENPKYLQLELGTFLPILLPGFCMTSHFLLKEDREIFNLPRSL
jgi:hypothetical protein